MCPRKEVSDEFDQIFNWLCINSLSTWRNWVYWYKNICNICPSSFAIFRVRNVWVLKFTSAQDFNTVKLCCNEYIQLSANWQLLIAIELSEYITFKATRLMFSEPQYLLYLYENKKKVHVVRYEGKVKIFCSWGLDVLGHLKSEIHS